MFKTLKERIYLKLLKNSLELIMDAEPKYKKILFKEVYKLDHAQKEFEELEDNRFDSHERRADNAMDNIIFFTRKITGYNCCWVRDVYQEYCSIQAIGRKRKYDNDGRDLHCKMITLMVNRGSSETQAMRFIMKATGDKAMSEGYLRELRDSYRSYKKLNLNNYDEDTIDLLEEAYCVGDALKWSIDEDTLTDSTKAYSKAVDAFRKIYQESIDYMKDYHSILEKHDNCYPDIFGCMIDVIKENHDDPLLYFFNNEKYEKIPAHYRGRCLMQYLQAIRYFWKKDDTLN